MDTQSGQKTYFFVVSWIFFLLNAVFWIFEILDKTTKLFGWIKEFCGSKKIVDVNAQEETEITEKRTVNTQTSGHYNWKSTRPCVTDLKNDKAHGIWEIVVVDGREIDLRINMDE